MVKNGIFDSNDSNDLGVSEHMTLVNIASIEVNTIAVHPGSVFSHFSKGRNYSNSYIILDQKNHLSINMGCSLFKCIANDSHSVDSGGLLLNYFLSTDF